jgi:hypothetical protein
MFSSSLTGLCSLSWPATPGHARPWYLPPDANQTRPHLRLVAAMQKVIVKRWQGMARSLVAGLVAGCVGQAQAAFITVNDMLASQWRLVVVLDQAPSSLTQTVVANLGGPGDSEWLLNYALPRTPAPFDLTQSQSNLFDAIVWDPATHGALESFTLSLDVRGRSSTFASGGTGFVRGVFEQNGVRFARADSFVPISVSAREVTLSWIYDDTTSWVSSSSTVKRPDFSASGGALHFGYQYGSRAVCTGVGFCTAVAHSTSVDNLVVDVTRRSPPAGTVPEPGALLLAGTALGLLLRRKAKSPGL